MAGIRHICCLPQEQEQQQQQEPPWFCLHIDLNIAGHLKSVLNRISFSHFAFDTTFRMHEFDRIPSQSSRANLTENLDDNQHTKYWEIPKITKSTQVYTFPHIQRL